MRAPPKPLDAYPFVTEHDLRFADMDMLGHVNNSAYGSFMETSRTSLFSGCTVPGHISIALVRFEIDYLKEMRWPGRALAPSGVEHVGGSSFRLRQAVFADGVARAEAVSTLCLLNLETRRAAPIDEALRAELARWMMRG